MDQTNGTMFGIPLARLNKDSAKVGEFYVRVIAPKMKKYTYTSKWNQKEQQGQRFTCHLVDYDLKCYLRGEVAGKPEQVDAAYKKFLAGTAWKLSKTCLSAKATPAWIGGPLKMVIDLEKTACTAILEGAKEEVHLKKTISPPGKVSDAMVLTSQVTFDLLAMVREIGTKRTVNLNGEQKTVANAFLIDGSQTPDGKDAELELSIFGDDLVKAAVLHVPLIFVGLSSKVTRGLTVSTIRDAEIFTAVGSEKAQKLLSSKDTLLAAQNRHVVTSSFVPTSSVDVSGEVTLSCAAVLEAMADAAAAMPPNFGFQLNWARVEEPTPGSKVLTNDEDRIFFTTLVRDFSGSTTTGINQPTALALSGAASKEEFVQQHEKGEVKFPLFVSVRGVRRVKPKTSTGAISLMMRLTPRPANRWSLYLRTVAQWTSRRPCRPTNPAKHC